MSGASTPCRRCSSPVPHVGSGAFKLKPQHCDACRAEVEAERNSAERSEEDARLEFEKRKREAGILDALHRAGANPWEHGCATLDSFDGSAVAAVREFITETASAGKYDPVRGLYLFGETGTGKTHLAVSVLREFLLDPATPHDSVVFDHASSLLVEIQDTYNTHQSTKAILERRIDARVWILDDLGTERASDDVVQRLTHIFTERALRPTLVTSNNSPGTLEARHPEFRRVQSRLGPAYFRTVEVQGRDRRFDTRAA